MQPDWRDRSERRRRLDRAWSLFVDRGEIDASVRPEIARSWKRTREFLGVDPRLARAPLVDPDELARRREQSDLLEIAAPVLDEYALRLQEHGHVLAFFDGAGCMLAIGGDAAAIERAREANFCPGASWREDATGTNAPGTALAERRAIEVFASEHYVQGWHEWTGAAALVTLPGASEPLGIVDIGAPWDTPEPQTLLAATAVASIIEERVRGIQAMRSELVRHALRVASSSGDALIAVDARGRLLAANDAAHRRLALDPRELPALREKLTALLPRDGTAPEDEFTFEWPSAADPRRRVIAASVNHDGRAVGAILRVPQPRAPAPVAQALAAPAAVATPTPLSRARHLHAVGQQRPAPGVRYSFADVHGQSQAILQALALGSVAARNDLPVVIHGESGTGKELFAQGIHGDSVRAGAPFVAVNCGAIPSALIEAELFGYEGGTFTGGHREGKAGKLEDAHGGTLFLDEVSELSPQAQTALLRVLQESEVVRLGGATPRPVDVRVVVATNKDLAREVGAGRFRQDLFFRLHVLTIEIPPLRARGRDVEILARAFLDDAQERVGRSGLELSGEAAGALAAHAWPGNVRELKNVMLRAAAVARGSIITAADLQLVDVTAPPAPAPPVAAPAFEPPRVAGPIFPRAPEYVDAAAVDVDGGPEAEAEREELIAALHASSWNIARTATNLGVSRMTLYRRLRKFDITR